MKEGEGKRNKRKRKEREGERGRGTGKGIMFWENYECGKWHRVNQSQIFERELYSKELNMPVTIKT